MYPHPISFHVHWKLNRRMHLKINIIILKKHQNSKWKNIPSSWKRLSQDSDESQHSTYVNFIIFYNIFWGK
jgi:hypothetical protein